MRCYGVGILNQENGISQAFALRHICVNVISGMFLVWHSNVPGCFPVLGEPLGLRRRLHSVPHVSEGPVAERLSPVRPSAAVDRVKRPSPESQSSNLWVVVGVVIPVLVVTVIVVILYWKLCRTDKLDFQPDTVANIQQRQKVSSHPCPQERPYGADTRQVSDAERQGRTIERTLWSIGGVLCPHVCLL